MSKFTLSLNLCSEDILNGMECGYDRDKFISEILEMSDNSLLYDEIEYRLKRKKINAERLLELIPRDEIIDFLQE